MCIAIVKPVGTELPDKDLLKRCWDNNPDGAGLMYNDGENVIIHKGFTKFKGFYKYLRNLNNRVDLKDKDLVLHFRIATSGGVSRECTHPFPVTPDIEKMKKLDCICDYGFAHNGIISGFGSKDYSDTMEYDAKIISNIQDLDNSEPLIDKLAKSHSSRFVVLTKDNFELGGDWTKDKDCYFSNTYYKYSTPTTYKTYKGGSVIDYYDEDSCEWCGCNMGKKNLIATKYGNICKYCFEDWLDEIAMEKEYENSLEREYQELKFE